MLLTLMASYSTLTLQFPQLENTFLIKFYGIESLNHGFNYYLDIESSLGFEYIKTYLGKKFQIIYHYQSNKRFFSGIMIHAVELTHQHPRFAYRIKLTSYLQILKFSNDFRIFKKTTLSDIITNIHHEHQLSKPHIITHHASVPISYFVQFDENTNHFIKRLINHYHSFFYTIQMESDHQIVYTDHSQLATKPIRQLNHSQLALYDYQLWNLKDDSASSTYPNINITDRITQDQFVTEIKHTIINNSHHNESAERDEVCLYYQKIHFKQLSEIKFNSPMPPQTGLQKAALVDNNGINPAWDYRHQHTPILTQTQLYYHNKSILLFKINDGNPVLVTHKNNDINFPYIAGAMYSQKNHAPFIYTKPNPCFGFYSASRNFIQFQSDSLTFSGKNQLSIEARSNLQIKATSNLQLHSKNKFQFHAKKSLSITSNHQIFIGNDKNHIILYPDKIIIKGSMINFNT